MKLIRKATAHIVFAAKGNPLIAVAVVFLAYIAFNTLEALIEQLIFGERFPHWLDIPFVLAFIAWGGYTVYLCAHYNAE